MSLDMFGIEEITGNNLDFLKDIECVLVDTEEKLISAFDRLEATLEPIAIDTETEGLSPLHHDIVGVIMSLNEKNSFYFPIKHRIGNNLNKESFISKFRKLCETKKFILFNAKFDWKMIYYQWGIDFEIAGDSQVQAYLLNSDSAESGGYSLKKLTQEVFGIKPLELSDFGITNFSLLDTSEAYKYACPDGTNTYKLYNYFKPKIAEYKLEILEKIELGVIKPVGMMELNGIKLDTQVLDAQKTTMVERLSYLEEEIYKLAGKKFDLASPKQMSTILYDDLGIKPRIIKGTGGNPDKEDRSVGVDQLKYLMGKHEIIALIQAHRSIDKLYRDFIIKLPEVISEDGRIRGNFNEKGTRSGRFSASGGFGKGGEKIKLNLQQLPKGKGFELPLVAYIPPEKENLFDFSLEYDEEELKELYPDYSKNTVGKQLKYIKYISVKIRDALVPSDNYYWLSCDYSQLEYRCLSNMALDDYLITSFNKGIDFHVATAAALFSTSIDKVDKKMRKRGKCVTGDTFIFTKNKGLVKIKDLSSFRRIDEFTDIDTIFVPNIKGEYNGSFNFYYNGIQDVTNIVTSYGYKLGGSSDKHEIKVVGDDGFPVYKKVSDISLEDEVVLYTGGIDNVCDYHVLKNFKTFIKDDRAIEPHIHKITEGVAEFLGIILSGDLSYEGNSILKYKTTDELTFNNLNSLLMDIWKCNKQIIVDLETLSVYINSKALFYQIKQLFFDKNNLIVPKEILESPKSVQTAFLKGLLSNAIILEDKLEIRSASREFISDLQQLFLSFGIISFSDKKSNIEICDIFTLSLDLFSYGSILYRLLNIEKSKKFEFPKDGSVKSGDKVLYKLDLGSLDNFLSELSFSQKEKVLDLFSVPGGKLYALKFLRSLLPIDSCKYDLLDSIINNRIISLPIKNIYKTEEEVFDIFVPQGNEFISNGFISKNTLNFGIVYGMSEWGLAERLGCSVDEAKSLMKKYFADKPGVVKLIDNIKKSVKSEGFVRTFFGRIRWFKDKLKEANSYSKEERILKQAFNTCVQGTGADFAKIALARVYNAIKPYGDKVRILSQVHDEINLEFSNSIPKEEAISLIDTAMSFRNIVDGWTSIPGDIEIGDSYGSMKEIKDLGFSLEESIKKYKFIPEDISYLVPKEDMLSSSNTKVKKQKVEKKVDKQQNSNQIAANFNSKLKTEISKKDKVKEKVKMEDLVFKVPTVYLRVKDGIDGEQAINCLRKFIADNFGTYQLLLEFEDMVYSFPSEYLVSDKVESLELFFDIKISKEKPKLKLSF